MKNLPGYARFLLEHHLDELTRFTIERAREVELPMLQGFAHFSEEALFSFSRQSLQTLLTDLCEGSALDAHLVSVNRWKENKMPEVPSLSVNSSDVALSIHIRKYALYKLLGRYTQQGEEYEAITQEIELFYTQCLTTSLEAFMEVQQQALQKEKDLLQTVVDTTREGMVVLDRELKVTLWNQALEKRTGVRRKDILGKPVFQFFPNNTQSEEELAARKALQGETVHLSDEPIKSRDGFFDLDVVPLRDTHGSIVGCLSVSRDVTERKRADSALQASRAEILAQQEELEVANEELLEQVARLEEVQQSLSESEALLKEAQAIAHLGYYSYRVPEQLLYWSDEMQQIFGRSASFEEMSGEGYYAMIHPEDQAFAREVFTEAQGRGGPFSLEHRLQRPDGTVRWVLLQGRVQNSPSGTFERMDGTCLDITERKEAELKLASERYFIQKLTDTSPDVITLYDLEQGMNLYSSREIYSLLGYSPEEMARIVQLGQSAFVDYFHPDDLANIFVFLETYKTYQGEAPREIEYRIRNAAGQWVWINDRYSVFRRNAEGFPSQIMGVARNVSERKQAEQEIKEKNGQLQEAYEEMAAAQEELRQTNEELSRINDELERRVGERTVQLAEALEETRRQNQALLQTNTDLDNFVYTASHDLKSPVTNLEGLLGVFQRKVSQRLESSESKLVDLMEASVLKLKATIIGLLEITRAQKDLPEEREMVSFEEVIEEVKADISPMLVESEARVHLNLEAKGIRSARTHVRSIVYNLLSNALKYRSPDRTPDIRISTHQEGKYLVLCVEDNGLGLSHSQQAQLFKMFKRLHDHVEGSGIGLYIIKRIVDNQGGTIQVESQEGQGTTFRVYLLNSPSNNLES